jgi:hypothetical protein
MCIIKQRGTLKKFLGRRRCIFDTAQEKKWWLCESAARENIDNGASIFYQLTSTANKFSRGAAQQKYTGSAFL